MNDINEEIKNENEQSANSSEQGFEFITETIKDKPVSKRKVILRVISTCILALVFGAITCFTFVSLYPIFNEWLHPVDDTKVVSLGQPEDEQSADNVTSVKDDDKENDGREGNPTGDNTGDENKDTDDNSAGNTASDDTSGKDAESSGSTNIDEALPAPEVITKVVETVEKDLELDDYAALYQQISDVATEAKRAIVTVTGVSANTDWFMNVYENKHTSAGLILAENGKEMLILTKTSAINSSDKIAVTFCDGARYSAICK